VQIHTRYDLDALGRPLSVTANADSALSTPSAASTYQYDPRGVT